jgi:hypothetical protein
MRWSRSGLLIRTAGSAAVLFVVALAAGRTDAASLGLMAFAVLNAAVAVPGGRWVRWGTFGLVLAAVALPGMSETVVILLLCLAWPPAMLLVWALSGDADASEAAQVPAAAQRARVTVSAIVVAVALAALAFRLLRYGSLHQTAALFVGIPALLAVVVTLAVTPRSAVGVACKAVTIGLLVSLFFLGEGLVCVVMSAPLFYLVAILVAKTMARMREQSHRRGRVLFSSVLVLALAPMSLEGVAELASLPRDESVTVTRVVGAPAAGVERALASTPRFDRTLPPYLRVGFPRPVSVRIDRGPAGRHWVVRFRGGEFGITGIEPRAGDLVLRLHDQRPGRMTWLAVSDDSHTTHYLRWRESTVTWDAIDARTTRVTWTLRYRRGLDPAWYFGPWERYAARLAAGYLIDSVATP